MASVEIKQPDIVVIEFQQEKGDPDYGTCSWARFKFDCDNYELTIVSDCGDYNYGWSITPSESFLHLMARIDEDYLLSKISSLSQIDIDKSLNCVEDLIKWNTLDEFDIDVEDIKRKIRRSCTDYEFMDALNDYLLSRDIVIDDYELWACIRKDYPSGAQKIAEIFKNYIQPAIKEYDA